MALATRCPACNTVFRISTAQAAAKGGMVRCGQCSGTFNSLDALVRVEDLEVLDEVALHNEVEPTVLPPQADAIDDPPLELDFDPHPGVDFDAYDSVALDALDQGTILDDARPRAVFSEWWLPDPNAPTTGSTQGPTLAPARAATIVPESRTGASPRTTGRRTDFREPVVGIGGSSYLQPDEPATRHGRAARWAFGLASLLAAIALVGQGAYYWRDEIAARWPVSRAWLTLACQPLRCAVGYPVHAESITIESTAVQTAGPNSNQYTLTALLRNRDAIDVRYPHLTLVLTDLQDRPILRRALRPQDYLPALPTTPQAFPAESELPLRVTFELNDLRFAGYRLEKFDP